tara:strand:+ start:177 stop:1145 length:969 start_codon:yes stop_codon:yes gene_type:complete
MDDLTIIGAGLATQNLINHLGEKKVKTNITLIDKRNYYIPGKNLILNPSDYSQRIDLEAWAKESSLDFLQAKVEKINVRRKKIYLKNADAVEYKNLIIASGLIANNLTLKGQHREGFFYLSEIDPFLLNDLLKISNEAVVSVSTILGIILSLSLRALGKEVRVIASNFDFLGEAKDRVLDLFKAKEINLHLGSSIEEIVGETRIKATKIMPLKVFSSQLVFVDSGFKQNIDFFDEELKINDTFFTNFSDLYLLGEVNNQDVSRDRFFINNYEEVKRQGEVFSKYIISGLKPDFKRIIPENTDILSYLDEILKEENIWQSGLA